MAGVTSAAWIPSGAAQAGQWGTMTTPVLPLHMGGLHPYEQVLTLLLAFGPFLLLAVVVLVRRRQDRRDGLRDGLRDGQRDR